MTKLKIKKTMIKKFMCMLLTIILCLTVSGCSGYVGLEDISIVIGMAIDKNAIDGNYQLTFEMVDIVSAGKDEPTKTKDIESEGKTIFDAVRNAKSKLGNKLYFGNMEVIIISDQIAKNGEIKQAIDFLMRDQETRETLHVIISQEKSAKEILMASGMSNTIISQEIEDIITKDSKVTAKARNVELHEVYSTIEMQGTELALPVFRNVKNNEETITESNGVAVFKAGRLIGYLSPEETQYYLFAVDEIKGSLLTFNLENNEQKAITLEIENSKTKMSYSYDGRINAILDIKTSVHIGESAQTKEILNQVAVEKIQDAANEFLKQEISAVIKKVQTQFDSDIFGFGTMVYRKNPKLWNQITRDKKNYFKTVHVEIRPEITIVNTGFLKK